MITILDIRHDCPANTIYVGRPMPRYRNPKLDYRLLGAITAGSALGNPWRPGEDADPIGRYRRWLWNAVNEGRRLPCCELERLVKAHAVGDITLACWCAKQPRSPYARPWEHADGCHADVVAGCVVWLAERVAVEAVCEH